MNFWSPLDNIHNKEDEDEKEDINMIKATAPTPK
jgi:hypothetical protein